VLIRLGVHQFRLDVRRFHRIFFFLLQVWHKFESSVVQFTIATLTILPVHISTPKAPRHFQRSPVFRHTCLYQNPDTVLYLFTPFVIYSSDDVISASPTTCQVTLRSPFFIPLTFRPPLLQHKFFDLQNLLGPWLERALRFSVYLFPCIRFCAGTVTTNIPCNHVL
jgi:hypothetical protein